jgi:hypothetical protein
MTTTKIRDPDELLREDLRYEMRERLYLWLKDSKTRYEIAEIKRTYALSDILEVLLTFTLQGVALFDFNPKEFASLIETALAQAIAARAQTDVKEESTR